MAERVTVTVRDAVTLALEDWQVDGVCEAVMLALED
jgi:hypothetical protein